MGRIRIFVAALLAALSAGCAVAGDGLWDKFLNPARDARTKLWWFHGETTTTREGIDADLRAFRDAGIGGVVFYDQTHGAESGAFASMSPEWWEMLKYAARRAKELGLSFEMASTNGYVAGGPWISPEDGMQNIVVLRPGDKEPRGFRELATVALPEGLDTCIQRERLTLMDDAPAMITFDAGRECEMRTVSYMVKPRGKGSFGSMNIPGKPQERYFGAGYVDYPPIGSLEYSRDGKSWSKAADLLGVEDIIGHKSRQRTISFPAVRGRYYRLNIHGWLGPKGKANKLEIENVRLMERDMIDNWEVKAGLRSEVTYPHDAGGDHGVVGGAGGGGYVRIGYAPTGGHSKHGRTRICWEGRELSSKTWLEADVMSAEAAELHYNSYFKAVYDTLSAIGCPPQGFCMDSHEAGVANWTAKMPEHFRRLRGYDIEPWLPALAGYIVESRERTEAFLRDFRRTIDEVISECFYGKLAELCHRDGVTFTSQAMLGCANDNIASRGMVDKPQGEFWGYQVNGNFDCLDATSAAHLYGKAISSGEAFTDASYFADDNSTEEECIGGWHRLLRIANLAYCRGVNEFVVCASSYQPWLDRKYDDSKSAHPYIFHRLNPAWPVSRQHFWEYQARCAQMLRMGTPVVDMLVYIGGDAPLKTMTYKLPAMPEGYNYDVCTLRSLRHWMGMGDNPHAPAYRMLVVQDRTYISEEAEAMFAELQGRGMEIVRCDKGETVEEAVRRVGLSPDISIRSADEPADKTYFYHRETDDADIYFVYNHSAHDYETDVRLRTARKSLELWNPLTAERRGMDDARLALKPYESVFIIARDGQGTAVEK